MGIYRKHRNALLGVYLGAILSASCGLAAHSAVSMTDEECRKRVEDALREDRYFYGAHVTVTVKKGAMVMQGFVFSDWDLRDAIRIATKAAGGRRVVDDLSIEVGGRR
jgi:osmotically-inducible protein OsmY